MKNKLLTSYFILYASLSCFAEERFSERFTAVWGNRGQADICNY